MDKTSKTIDSYNQCAATFAAQHMDLGIYQKFITGFSALLKPHAQILDLGCGPGNVARFLLDQNKGYHLLGVDLSPEMLRLARRNVPQATFVLSDLRNWEPDQKFDAIISSFSIIHLSDPEARELLRKTFDWLNAGGYLYVNFMEGSTAGYELASFSEQPIFFNYYQAETFTQNLQEIGYHLIALHSQDYTRSNGLVIKDVFVTAQK